jgi:signal transduction histidine kinase/DNA-binding response OmpR family regulator
MATSDPIQILLVEDHPEQLRVLAEALDSPSYRVVTARSGDEALEAALNQDFAVMLMDIQMPGMDGFETAQLIRGRRRTKDTPIIFLTGFDTSPERISQASALGAADYLTKPVDVRLLESKVRAFVQLFQARQRLEDEVRSRTEELLKTNRVLRQEAEVRQRAEQALVESRDRMRFLADAGALLSSTLDYEKALANLASLAVPRIADSCTIYVLGSDGAPRRAAIAHRDEQRGREIALMEDRFPLAADAPFGHPFVLRSGQAQLLPEVTDQMILAVAPGPEPLALIRSLGLRSYMCVPIRAHGKMLGALALATAESGRRFGSDDLAFAQEFADRAAIAVDNARLYQSIVDFNKILELRVEERTAELRSAMRELDTFAYTVAHDLRAPLRAMTSFSEILLEEGRERLGPELAGYATRILQASKNMDAMVQDLLAYCHLARQDLELETVDLGGLVREVLTKMKPELDVRGAVVEVESPLPEVRGNRVGLSQALTNLLQNAAKYVAPGVVPHIRMRAETRRGRVRLWVEDNGIGIAPEYHEKIFGLFQRLHAPEAYLGTGIGLSIVRKALEKMRGATGLESELGKGSRFWIELAKPRSP